MSRYRKTMNEALNEVNNRHNIEENISVKKYKNAVTPDKDGLQISKSGGMSGSIFIKNKKELKDLLDKLNKNSSNLKEEIVLQEVDLKEFEEVELNEFTVDQISKLAKSYADLAGKTMSMANVNKLRKIFDKIPDSSLNDLRKKKIPFISGLALSRMIQKKMPVTEDMSQGFVVKFTSKKDGKIGSAWYKDEKDAKEFLSKLKSDGGNGVISKNDGKYFDETTDEVMIGENNTQKYTWKDINIALTNSGMSPQQILKVISALKGKHIKEETLVEFTDKQITMAKGIAFDKRYKGGNMTKATEMINKIAKGLADNPEVANALRQANEEVEVEEGKMSDIHNMMKDGKSATEIAKALKLNPKTLKDILGEVQEANDVPATDKKEPTEEGESVEKQLMAALAQVALLKQKLENEKNKAVKPKPNPITGEVPLTVGIAHAEFKKEKEKEVKETYIVKYVDPLNKKNLRMKHPNEKDAQDMKDRLKKSGVKEIEIVKEAMSDKENRVQRAKDMIKYYDAQKKAALKGKNKDLAKKMLKNEMTGAANLVDKILSKKLKGEK
jgi:hypothetical protein